LEGVIEEARKIDLDKLERDVDEEGNRIAQERLKKGTLAVEIHREGKLSLGKAAELAGTKSKWEMLMLLSVRGVPLDYTVDDAEKDLRTLEVVLGL
jgi:predicted HTH domain antitoxin